MKHMDHNYTFQKYPAYKDSGVEWIGEVPKEWEVRRLRNVCKMLVSNVDKLSKPLEYPIRLCNYVDVYKNEFITSDIQFMEATASTDEIRRFSIKIDDVIITKDSEDWLDIGVPALVKYEDKKLICGYHLAILRPKKSTSGQFLHRALLSQYIRTQFSVKANGVTRYGISHGAILGTFIVIPPLLEQTRIAHFLDRKTAQIDQAIAQKERLIELLKERRLVYVNQILTRGLDSKYSYKDSKIEGLGQIPSHWESIGLKYLLQERNERSTNGEEPLLMVSQIHGLVVRADYHEKATVAQSNVGNKRVHKNDLVFNKLKAHLGVFFKSNIEEVGIVSPDYAVYYPLGGITDLKFLELLFRHPIYIGQFICKATGIIEGLIRLYTSDLFSIKVPVPPKYEQTLILERIETGTHKIDIAIGCKQAEIEKLKEYKATLINSAVTGKIKV
jgi:type I restriction enzyme S subunit